MSAIHTKWKSTVPGAGPNKLAMAAALTDDADDKATASGVQTPVEKKDAPPPTLPTEQRIILLQALLSIGAMPQAMFLLGKYPWTAQSHPAIADLLLRNLEYSLDPVYEAHWPLPAAEEDLEWSSPAPFANNNKVVLQTTCWPVPLETPKHRFDFFYPDWTSHLARWSTVDELHVHGLPWMHLVRGLGARNPTLMVKLCRLGVAHFRPLRKAKMDAHGLDRLSLSKNRRLVEVGFQCSRNFANFSQRKPKWRLGSASCESSFSLLLQSPYTLRHSTSRSGHYSSSFPTKHVTLCTENGGM